MTEQPDVPASTPLDDWLAALGRPIGAPGGGAASGVMLGIAAALLRMVAEYTIDDPQATESGRRLTGHRRDALAAAEADGVLSAEFGAALGMPTDDPGRESRVRDAAVAAADSSARLGAIGIRLLDEVRLLAEIGNPHLVSDLAVAAQALAAGLSGAIINLRANMRTARKHDAAESRLARLRADEARLSEARQAVSAIADEVAPPLDD